HAMDSLAQARDWMLLLGQKSAEERVATFLLRMAERQADTGCAKRAHESVANGTTIDVPITRAQIAAYLGLTIETVSRRLTALRDAKLIALQSSRSITLLDVPALQRTAGRLMDADCG
ncbi:MAG: helix-turn-helix domain-containing protein, partial [Pseudomonadota bacterium]